MRRHGIRTVCLILILMTIYFPCSCAAGVLNPIARADSSTVNQAGVQLTDADIAGDLLLRAHSGIVQPSIALWINERVPWEANQSGNAHVFVFCILLIVGGLHLLFFAYLPGKLSNLLVSGLCVALALFSVFSIQIGSPGTGKIEDFGVLTVITIILSLVPFFFLILMARDSYPEDSIRRVEKALIILLTAGIPLIPILILINPGYGRVSALVTPGIVLFYYTAVTFKALIQRRNNSVLMVCGLLLLLVSGILNQSRSHLLLIEYVHPMGVVFFIVFASLVLLKRHLQPYTVFKALSMELHKKEEEIGQKNRELASLERLKEEYLENISRELQAPLQAIVSLTESLVRKINSSLSREFSGSFQLVYFNCKRLSILIDNVLDHTRLNHNRLHLNLTQFHIQSLVDSVIELSELNAKHKSIRLVNKIPCSFPVVFGDKRRTYQVLYNLIENAIKFTDNGVIEISTVKDGKDAKISITDSGIGIEKQFQQTIFHDFEKLVHWEEKQNTGMGLGLSITKKLIEQQGGTIWLDSTVDIGSSFSFSLPLAETTPSPQKEQSPIEARESIPAEMHKSGEENCSQSEVIDSNLTQIWIIDDDAVNQQVVSGFLSSDQVRISSYHEESKPLKNIALGNIPDLILLDVLMPQTSGFELCRKIRNRFSMTELPIIFLTSKNSISDLVEAFSLGANDFIVKPFQRDELVSRVNSQLHQLKINKNMVSLRNFNRSIVNKRDPKSMVLEALSTIQTGILTSGISLFQDEKLIKVLNGQSHDDSFELAPSKDLFMEIDSENDSDLFICNKLPAEHPLCRFYQNQTNTSITNASVVSIFLEDLENMNILIFRDALNPGFTNYEVEYLKSIIYSMNTIRQNYRKLFSNSSLVDAVAFINKKLQEIVYIKSIHPFSQVFYRQGKNLESKEVQISMQDIQAYFDEKYMLRIHRSFFINPNRVLSVRKKNQIDFEVKIKTESDDSQKLNIGRNYVNHFRKLHPHFF